jgi:hypothetical protein
MRAGAHTKHLARGFICEDCHVKPVDALSQGHLDGEYATVTFGPFAKGGNAFPTWNRLDGTCATTYCHGGYSGTYNYSTWDYALDQPVPATAQYAGGNGKPVWNNGPMACDSCHGNPPSQNRAWHGSHNGGNDCSLCHPNAAGTPGNSYITDPSTHVDGKIDLAPRYESRCFRCH